MTEVVVYHATDCHLCERALSQVRALQAELGFELREVLIDGDPELEGALPRMDPRRRDRRRAAGSRTSSSRTRSGAAVAQAASLVRRLLEQSPLLQAATNGGQCGGTPDCRRRCASVAVPPGADAGAEDGQGPDLLAGDRGLHEHQRDPDPARPLRVRQVRQARRRLHDRLAARARSARSSARRASTTSPSSARGRLGQAIASSPIFAEHGINIAAVFDTDPAKVGSPIGNVEVAAVRAAAARSCRDKNIVVGVLAVPAERGAAGGRRPRRRRRARSSSTTPRRCSRRPRDVTVHTSNPAVELLYALYFHLT